jgi:WD40 repeat protein
MLELLLTDPRLIERLCLQPLASAKERPKPSSPSTLGTLNLKYGDGTIEMIELLVPFGHIRRGGRVLVADLDPLRKHVKVAAESAFGFLDDGRPANCKVLLGGNEKRIFAFAFSFDGQHLASAGDDSDIKIWRTATGTVRSLIDRQGPARSVTFSPDGKLLALGREDEKAKRPEGLIRIVEWETGNVRASFHCGLYGGLSSAFTQDGGLIASGRLSGVTVWDLPTGREVANLKAGPGIVSHTAFAPDGKRLVTGNFDGGVVLWDLTAKNARASRRGHGRAVTSVAFSPDGKRFATTSKANDLKLWDGTTGDEVAHYQEGLGSGWADRSCYAAFAPDGRAIFSVSELKVRARDVATGKIAASCELSLGGRKLYVEKMMFSPDCKTLAAICRPQAEKEAGDASIALWDIASLMQGASGK